MTVKDATATIARAVRQPGKKYFTLQEANRALPYVTRVVRDVTAMYEQIVGTRRRIECPGAGDSQEHLEAQYESQTEKLSIFVDELSHVGVELKDFEKGLLDFPAVHEEREIYLCWKLGEETVTAWHEIDTGYAGRKNVSLLGE